MRKRFYHLIMICLIFTLFSAVHAETTLIKNATVYMPSHEYQADSYIIVDGCKILKIGKMTGLKDGIFDSEYDLEGNFLYPAFIDSYYRGFVQKKKKTAKKDDPKRDKNNRPRLALRHPYIGEKMVDKIALSKSSMKKLIKYGFAYAHVVPEKGIIGGTTVVLSLRSIITTESVLVPEMFMNLNLKPNKFFYPTTVSSIVADLKQLKEDCLYVNKQKRWQFSDPKDRLLYSPELDILNPYMTGQNQFFLNIKDITEQRVAEIISKELKIRPVIVGHSDIWRRDVSSRDSLVLPLNFKPPLSSVYSKKGDKAKKMYEKELYPKKLSDFFKSHRDISLAPPDSGDYKTLFKNIGEMKKNGVEESKIIDALTVNPARLLKIHRYAGSIAPGKLASFFVADKKVFEEKSKIRMAFVEGTLFEFLEKPKDMKPPVRNLTGSWLVKLESQMGNFDVKLVLEQDENQLEGKMSSEMLGSLDIENGTISGAEVNFAVTANMMGNEIKIQYSGKVAEDTIKGTVSLGSFGDATFTATPEK